MRHACCALVVTMLAMLALACERPRFVAGEGCEINSDCAAPLICAIGACRRQCITSRDCGAGLRCLMGESTELGGGCQLEHERTCSLTSECASADLVCQNGTCTTPCVADRDCPAGARCRRDAMEILGCYEEMIEPCVYPSDCDAPLICGPDQMCRLECVGDRDCTTPRVCIANLCELPDGGR
ncbi:MAG: hypothetical protein M3Y87_21540 [Myxococcota bacterium]|nr:hypothetical protein [Myxococcota bacterium]